MSGENLFNAANIMKRAGDEINAMLEKLFTILSKELKTVKDIREIEETSDQDDEFNDWCTTGYIVNYGIYRKARKNPSAWLGIQIKLCDMMEREIVGPQPLLYILFSVDEEWELDKFLVNNALAERFILEDECLWRRYKEDEDPSTDRPWHEADCAFVIPLVDINTPEDLHSLIVEPIRQLMNSNLEPKNLDGRILRFMVEDSQVKLLS
jgi:hypothetical protein